MSGLRSRAGLLGACAAAALATAALNAGAEPPLAESRCPTGALVDPAFRDAALDALDRLVVRAPGLPAHGAVLSHQTAGFLDTQGHAWHQVSAYQVNLGLIGALNVGPRARPVAADWLRWQARHMASSGVTRGVVLDHWVRVDTFEESTCPSGMPPKQCADVDAYDSTAASMLLLADAYARRGGDTVLLREPAMRQALEDAAAAIANLSARSGLTIAKPTHRVSYLMDQVEVAAGWRAWARLQRDVYAQPASAVNTLASATQLEASVRARLWFDPAAAWSVSLGSGAPLRKRWYADTVAQAWPLLWSADLATPESARETWQRAIAPWQRGRDLHWATANVDPDGFWWPSVAVAALCTGDETSARTWVARARLRWMDSAAPFAWPFQVGDLLWLLWLAEPAPAPRTRVPVSP